MYGVVNVGGERDGFRSGIGARRSKFIRKERGNMRRNGEIEVGNKSRFSSNEGW